MNGASAEPLSKINSPPSNNRKTTIGAIHHFFRSRRKSRNSLMIASLFIAQGGWSCVQTIGGLQSLCPLRYHDAQGRRSSKALFLAASTSLHRKKGKRAKTAVRNLPALWTSARGESSKSLP